MEFEIVDELPAGGRGNSSEYTETIEAYKRAVDSGHIKPGKWTVIKVGDNKESIAATTSNLKDRFGPASANGLSFANRPYHNNPELRAIYVTYEPQKVVEGESRKYAESRAKKQHEANERSKVRKAEKEARAKAEANPTHTTESKPGSTAATPKGTTGQVQSKAS